MANQWGKSCGAGPTAPSDREPRVTLSPFSARLALVAFVGIASSIGYNLLVLQTPGTQRLAIIGKPARTTTPTDAEQLTRLALEAIGGARATVEPAIASRSGRRTAAQEPEAQTRVERIGSFAPSSGQLALSALPGADPAEARRANIRAIQTELARRGYEPGVANGAAGLVTRAAVLAYEHDQGLPLTGDPSPDDELHVRAREKTPAAE